MDDLSLLDDFEEQPSQLDDYTNMLFEVQSYCIKHNRAFCFYDYNPYRQQYSDMHFGNVIRRALVILNRYQLCGNFEELNQAADNLHYAFTQALSLIESEDAELAEWLESEPAEFFKGCVLKCC
ncbi:hypothetical protein [Bergeriella denitrificans]|uniref:Uncharacterized protein n=1 Tax=Bergeriella denitrificans TaxID=494 RepID=A0A378UI72_BERDE|nr:hypothetical protein [Bergeriella denitrificans]STZ76850.1 Uncharacterised protein [Bergeriella denitrificans]